MNQTSEPSEDRATEEDRRSTSDQAYPSRLRTEEWAVPDGYRVRAGLDKAAYEALWDQVSICRNKYIAHKDTDSDPIIFPQLDLCVLVAEELRCVLSDCVNAILLQTPDNKELKGLARFYRGQDNALIKRGSELQFITGLRTGATWAEKYVSTLWSGGPGSNAHRA